MSELHTILYVGRSLGDHSDHTFEALQLCFDRVKLPFHGFSYHLLAQQDSEYHGEVTCAVLRRMVSSLQRENLELVVINGEINNRIDASRLVRGIDGSRAKFGVAPIYAERFCGELPDQVERSGADVGFEFPMTYQEFSDALTNLFAGRTGGYIFNPEMYAEQNGLLVPKPLFTPAQS
jgi:hypothetical protein